MSRIETEAEGSPDWHQGAVYVERHAPRFQRTFALVSSLRGQSVLSLGAGVCAFEEVLLRRGIASHVTAVDLPEAVKSYSARYAGLGIAGVALDLTQVTEDTPSLGTYDLIIAAEVVEHLRTDPRALLRWCAKQLEPGGLLVVSTPNARALIAIVRHLRNIPYQEDPARVFGEATYRTEGVHVREYLPRELTAFARDAGLRVERHAFVIAMPIHSRLYPAPLRPLLRPFLPWQILMLRRDSGA